MTPSVDLSDVSLSELAAEIRKHDDPNYRLLDAGEEILSEASDDRILEEVTDRGYTILDEDEGEYVQLDEARSLLSRGDLRECLYAIERELPHEFSGLTERVFAAVAAKPAPASKPEFGRLPKRVQSIIDTVRHGQTLCCHKHLNREGATERMWFFEPSGKPATPRSAEAAVATSFLVSCGDGLFPNMAQTWRAAP